MVVFTRQERMVLVFFAVVLLAGSGLRYARARWPSAAEAVRFVERGGRDERVDLNTATAEELERIPHIGPVTARRIIEHRRTHGPFRDIAHLKNVRGIGPKTFEHIKEFLLPLRGGT